MFNLAATRAFEAIFAIFQQARTSIRKVHGNLLLQLVKAPFIQRRGARCMEHLPGTQTLCVFIPHSLHTSSHTPPSSHSYTMSVKLLSRVIRLPPGCICLPALCPMAGLLVFRPRGDMCVIISIRHIPYCHSHTLFVEPCCCCTPVFLSRQFHAIASFSQPSPVVLHGACHHL
jgi:hypothetical protein